MTAKPRARKFRVRRAEPLTLGFARPAGFAVVAGTEVPAAALPVIPTPLVTPVRAPDQAPVEAPVMSVVPAAEPPVASPEPLSPAETDIEAIRAEGLTGRQLRMARRVAQRHGLPATSDFEAVRELRARGIDPFQQTNLLALVQGGTDDDEAEGHDDAVVPARVQLPQTRPGTLPATRPARQTLPGPALPQGAPGSDAEAAGRRAAEIRRIQSDIARRRRRRFALLMVRLAVFVLLPTIAAGWYFTRVATPMYATRSEFVIQKAEAASGMGGLGGLFQGTSMATQQDSMTVQAYLMSRAALQRLDDDHGFRAVFEDVAIDPIQRLPADATAEAAYKLFQSHVKIAYDPTEGIVKMEVIAPDPATSEAFSRALIGYAEEQVDRLTERLRLDQMADARTSYEDSEKRRADALQAWLDAQAQAQQIDPIGETAARTQQISTLESQRQQLELELQTRLSVRRPNEAQVNALRSQIGNIEGLIESLRGEMTQASADGGSLAANNAELQVAEQNYGFQTLLVQQALTQMEAAQVEANRQVRYLSLGVEPLAPDEPTYPRAFENTMLAFLIFAGLYLMASLTASILREQVTS